MEDKLSAVPPAGKPSPRLEQAFEIAREKLARTDDLDLICRNTGGSCSLESAANYLSIDYLRRPIEVSLPDAGFSSSADTELSFREKLLVLHYLITAKGTPPAGKLVTFQELPDGHVYYPTFLKRAVEPLVCAFGTEPERIIKAAEIFSAEPAGLGDISVTVHAFPHVSLTIVIWRGDEEFEARGNILFDAGIPDYLPTEDITVLCETLAWKLIKSGSRP